MINSTLHKFETLKNRLRLYTWLLIVAWTLVVAGLLAWNLRQQQQEALNVAQTQARTASEQGMLYHQWAANYGGVYAPLDAGAEPNPYLKDRADREISLPSGQIYTLISPAQMTRQVLEMAAKRQGLVGHLTSPNPIRPENSPDPWEKAALQALQDNQLAEISAVEELDGQPYLRLMRPVYTEESCLECHAGQGFKVGQLDGGMSIAVPMAPLWDTSRPQAAALWFGHGLLWVVGLAGIVGGSLQLRQRFDHHHQVEETLRRNDAQNRALLDAIPDLIFRISRAGIYLDLKAGDDLGLPIVPSEIIGKHLYDVLPTAVADQRLYYIVLALETRQIQHFEYRLQLFGPNKVFEARVVPSGDDEVIMISRDITSRKQAEVELRMLSRAVEQGASAIMITNPEGIIEFVNPAFTKMTGFSAEETLGQKPSLVKSGVHPPELYELMWKTISQGKVWEGELLNKGKHGIFYWANLTISPVKDADGKITHFLGVQENITKRKQAEDQLATANEELERAILQANQLAIAAEEASRAKSEFLANMSHEIRTPMNGIIGMTELAMGTDLTLEQRDYLTAVQTSAESLLSLLNDILDFSKIEAGHLEIEDTPFDLRQVIDMVADIMAQRASQKMLELVLHVQPDIPAGVKGDPLRLRQILVNLVGNAIKFTHQGEIIVSVKPVRIESDEVELICSVSDTGIGIPEEKLDLIFESFSQADGSTTRQYGGTGLGLTISKQLVELMGGRIWVESELNQGSTFNFTIVLQRQPDWEPITPPGAVSIQDLRVLIVDDNATNRHILYETLHFFGCKPAAASDGREALNLLEQTAASGVPFDLLLLDFQMPGLSGLEVLQIIRANPAHQSLEVIILTSVDTLRHVTHQPDLGWSGYLIKPIKQSQLLDTMLQVLNGQSAAYSERAGSTPSAATSVITAAAPGAGPIRILLAEDNEINRRLATIILEQAGYQLTLAENGRIALERLEQADFDLILMDVQMPEMDGLAATAAIRANPRWENIPIIAMTAHALHGDRERFLAAGMDDYVTKPLRKDELLAAIERQRQSHLKDQPASVAATAAVPATTTAVAIPNLAEQIEALGGDETLFDELVQLLIEQSTQQLVEITAAIEQNNAESLYSLAHNLKGAAASTGAEGIRDAAQQLEAMGRSGHLAEARTMLSQLEQEVALLLQQFKALV